MINYQRGNLKLAMITCECGKKKAEPLACGMSKHKEPKNLVVLRKLAILSSIWKYKKRLFPREAPSEVSL